MIDLGDRLQEVGKIKIGGLGEKRDKKSGKGSYQMPTRLDHFIITKNSRNDQGNYEIDHDVMQKVAKDGKPREIDIFLVTPDIDGNWTSQFSYYTGTGKRFCYSDDGQRASRINHEFKEGQKAPIYHPGRYDLQCPNSECEYFGNGCKPYGILSCLLPSSPYIGGVYKFRTTSWNSIRNIQSSLKMFAGLTRNSLSGIPFILRISPKTTTRQTKEGPKKTTIQEVGLFFKGDINELLAHAREYGQRLVESKSSYYQIAHQVKQVEARVIPMDDQEEVAADIEAQREFYPDAGEPTKPTQDTEPKLLGAGVPPDDADLIEEEEDQPAPPEQQPVADQSEPAKEEELPSVEDMKKSGQLKFGTSVSKPKSKKKKKADDDTPPPGAGI